jgi:predicted phage tail protein
MKKFVLHGEMADLFGPEIDLDVSSPHEAIHALCVNLKGFRRYIIKKSLSGVSYEFVDTKKNKYESFCGHIVLKDNRYDIIASPQGHGGMMAFFGSNPIGAGLANAAMGFGMQKLVNKFTKGSIQEDDVPEYEVIETNSFIYSQNENKTQQGSPVPVIYGQLRVGTKVINSSVENYDYNNDDAYIYENPPNLDSIEMIHGGQYSFVLPPVGDDFRSTTDLDAFASFSAAGKRAMTFGENGAKEFDPNIGNEGQHESFNAGDEKQSKWDAMSMSKFGPSSNKPLKRSGGESSFKENDTIRPYVFPPSDQIDYWMRPQGHNDICIERETKNNIVVSENLAWVGSDINSDQMRIGNRGQFQKLESIGLYKSLEVLSEGPIAGLAMPISTTSTDDNGRVTYPLEVSDTQESTRSAKLSYLKYHDYVPAGNLQLADSSTNTATLTIKSAGSEYKDINGTLLDGAYSITGNDLTNHDHKLFIGMDAPNVSYSAKITDTTFDDSTSYDVGGTEYYLSENKIFLINPVDGELIMNSSGSNNPAKLAAKYYDSEYTFDLEALSDDPPKRLPDESEAIDFFVGENYPNGTTQYSIVPDNQKAEFDISIEPARHTEDIFSKAQCLDLGALMGHDIVGQTITTAYQQFETYDVSATVPGAVDRDGNSYNWTEMCRIFTAGSNSLPSDAKDKPVYIPVGFLARKDGLDFNPDTASNSSLTNLEYYLNAFKYENGKLKTTAPPDGMGVLQCAQLYVKLTVGEYIGLREVPDDWNGFENWYMSFGFGTTKIQVKEYVQMHTFSPSAANYPSWNIYEDYSSGNLVSHNGLVYEAKASITGDPKTSSYPAFDLTFSYPINSRVQHGGSTYKSKAAITGNPAPYKVDEWSRFNRYSTFSSSTATFPDVSQFNNTNTVTFGSKFYKRTGGTINPQPDDYGLKIALSSWLAATSYSKGDIFYDDAGSGLNDYYFAKQSIVGDPSNVEPTTNPTQFQKFEYLPPDVDSDWGEITLMAGNPSSLTTEWEEVSVENSSPPSPEKKWDGFSAFAQGECVAYGGQFYCATSTISSVVNPDTLPVWDPLGSYGITVDGGVSTVQYGGSVYTLKTGADISPEIDDGFLTDTEVETQYLINTTLYSDYASVNGIWPSVPKYDGAVLVENDPPDQANSIDWEEVEANPVPTASSSGWAENAEWKLKESSFSESFSKDNYYVHCDYMSREGIIQNPDPSPKSPGFFAGLLGKVKYIRQSNVNEHVDAITQSSDYWRKLINGDGKGIHMGDLIREDFQKATKTGNTAARYEKKIKKLLSGSTISHNFAEGTTLLYHHGPDFNEIILLEFESLYGSAGVPSSCLSSLGSRMGNSRQTGAIVQSVTLGSTSYNVSNSSQAIIDELEISAYKSSRTRHVRFVAGSGGDNLDGATYIDSFPEYMRQANKETFDDVAMYRKGYNEKDDSTNPYGFYDPTYYPRVTVFVLRKRTDGDVELCPTLIEAVAKVDSSTGTIDRVHLLGSSENPVYDHSMISENSNGFTPISPQNIEFARYNFQSADNRYQDVGIYLRIDATHGYHSVSFDATSGSLSSMSNGGQLGLASSWRDHIISDGVGIYREMPIMSNGQEIKIGEIGNTSGSVTVSTENSLDTSAAVDTTNLPTTINTGRVKSMSISNVGSGYDNKFQGYVFNRKYLVRSITSTGFERGYKPDSSFIVYGVPKSILDSTTSSSAIAPFAKFKARVHVNQYGSIQQSTTTPVGEQMKTPVQVIDSGYSFSDENDSLIFLSSTYHDDLSFSDQSKLTSVIGAVDSGISSTNESNFLVPELHFSKQTMILEATMSGGIVSKISISTNGLGFNGSRVLKDPFQLIDFRAPKFNLVFSSGVLQSASLDATYGTSGYSPSDTRVKTRFSNPFVPAGSFPPDNPNNDPYDKFRSIYLNDVPIRDHTDRFNYSKFHFDMRIGNYKNHHNTHPIEGDLAPLASFQLMSSEFRVPTHTKFVNYPLWGPRNEGEKDYYYTHTIKNPAITNVSFSIKIKQLHYIYEGDESAVYLNLVPIIGMILGWLLGKWIMEKIVKTIFPEVTIGFGMGTVVGLTVPGPTTAMEFVFAAMAWALVIGGGIIGALLAFSWLKKHFKCKMIPWLCIKIGNKIKNSGEIWPAKARFCIEHGVEGEELTKDTFIFRGCATSDYVKDIYINNLPEAQEIGVNTEIKKNRIFRVYRLTRELDPVTGGLVEARYKIGAELLSVTEYVDGYFSYPNTAIVGTRLNSKDHPSLPRREYLIKGRLIRIPSNYNPVNGTYSGVWNGQFHEKLQWTSNPAWIIFDLLTNDRYGMGKYGITDEDIDKWSFYKFAKRCDEKIDVIVEGVASEERRHMCNLYIDSERQAYDYIRDLMKIYNTKINFTAGTIHIVQDAPAEPDGGPVMLFNNSNVSEKGFAYSSTPETDRVTAVTVDFIDERDNYMNKTEYVEDAEGVRKHGYSHSKIAGLGITRRGEAHRLAWHKILTKQLEKEVINFETGIRAAYLRIGDVIEVMDNNKTAKHSGGRISSIIDSTTIEIDIPVEALGNTTSLYIESPVQDHDQWKANHSFALTDIVIHESLFYENTSGSNTGVPPNEDEANWVSSETIRQTQFQEYSISSKSGFNVVLSSNISSNIKEGFTWIIKENEEDKSKPRQYKIKEVKEISHLQYEVSGTDHIEDKYNQVDNSAGAQEGVEFESREYYGPPISIA